MHNMKKKILELLKTKFEGVSESILDRIAEKLVVNRFQIY